MLTSHTSSEEEKILYHRKFAPHIRNFNEGPQLLEDTADSLAVRKSSPGSRPRQYFPSLPTPRTGLLIPWRNSSTASAEEFYHSFHYNEGLENKLIRASLLGLARSIYYVKI